jgi:hypothetical protein
MGFPKPIVGQFGHKDSGRKRDNNNNSNNNQQGSQNRGSQRNSQRWPCSDLRYRGQPESQPGGWIFKTVSTLLPS